MDADRAAQQFVTLFHQLFLRFHQRGEASDYLPSPETVAILEHLARSGPLTVGEAARHLRRSQSTISEIVARLESRRLVERFPDRRDRRRGLVWLSDEGLEVLRRAQRILSPELIAEAWREWDSAGRADVLARLERLLRSPAPEDDDPGER